MDPSATVWNRALAAFSTLSLCCRGAFLGLWAWAAFAPNLTAQVISDPARDELAVRGIVLNRVTREPIARALVFSPGNGYATLTDARGRFHFTFPPREPAPAEISSDTFRMGLWMLHARPSSLSARKPGYLSIEGLSQVTINDSANPELTILLDPEGLVVGHVRFSAGDNADRIRLELLRRQIREGVERWEPAGTFTTWSDGEFRFYDLAPGTYKLVSQEQLDRDSATLNPRGQVFGYPPNFYANAPDFASAALIHLVAGGTFQANIALERRQYYPVRIGLANLPADASASVLVYPMGHPGPGYSLGYNPSEQRIEGLLPDGNYTVRVSTFGANAATGTLNVAINGAPSDKAAITLVPNTSMPVIVREEFSHDGNENGGLRSLPRDNEDASNPRRHFSQIDLSPAEPFGPQQNFVSHPVQTPDGQAYSIDAVWPGKYWAHVRSNDGYVASLMRGGIDLLHQPLVIGLGESSLPLEVLLRDDGAEVTGSVQNLSSPKNPREGPLGNWSPPAHVYFLPLGDGGGQFREAIVNPDGSFRAVQVPPGSYRVLAYTHEQRELEYPAPESQSSSEPNGQEIRVSPVQKLTLPSPLVALSDP